MKTIDIIGDNYFGKWDKTRTACRGIIIRGNEILLSYETLTEQWMLPGGGLEGKEKEIKAIFSRHDSYADTDEMRRGMYLREYTALCELLK